MLNNRPYINSLFNYNNTIMMSVQVILPNTKTVAIFANIQRSSAFLNLV